MDTIIPNFSEFRRLARQQTREDRMQIGAGEIITRDTRPLALLHVVTKLGMIKAELHVPLKGDGAGMMQYFKKVGMERSL